MKRTLLYGAINFLRVVANGLPREISKIGGAMIGSAAYAIQRRDRFRADCNLRAAYRNKYSEKKIRALTRGAFVNAGLNLADLIRLENCYNSELASLIDVQGEEHLREAYARGRGVIAATGHIGNFELLAAYCAQNGYKTAIVGRQLADSRVDEILLGIRKANGAQNIRTTEALKFAKHLREGFVIGTLIDSDSQRVRSDFVESYHRLAWTPISQTALGLRLGSAFCPVVCRTIGGRYQIKFFPEVRPTEFGNSRRGRELKVLDLTWRIRKILDREVDDDPTQWVWTHNRWNTRPKKSDPAPVFLEMIFWK